MRQRSQSADNSYVRFECRPPGSATRRFRRRTRQGFHARSRRRQRTAPVENRLVAGWDRGASMQDSAGAVAAPPRQPHERNASGPCIEIAGSDATTAAIRSRELGLNPSGRHDGKQDRKSEQSVSRFFIPLSRPAPLLIAPDQVTRRNRSTCLRSFGAQTRPRLICAAEFEVDHSITGSRSTRSIVPLTSKASQMKARRRWSERSSRV